jgi:hypothetical protein
VRAHAHVLFPQIPSKDRKAYEAQMCLAMWQGDTLYGPYLSGEGKHVRAYLQSIIDDKSRLIVSGRFFSNDNAANFQRVLKDGIARFGIPEKLYLDNGGPYANEQLTGICGQLGCVLIHAPVRDGAAKGKIERFNRTVRTRFLSTLDLGQVCTFTALNDAFVAWINTYNTSVHSATGKTPMEVYTKDIEHVRMPPNAAWLDACFKNRITRLVKNDGTIRIDKINYDAPIFLCGQKVECRFEPGAMEDAYILHEGTSYPLRQTNRTDNFKTPRDKGHYRVDYTEGDEQDV